MTAQVLFISKAQFDAEEMRRRQQLQDFISGARAGMFNRIQNLHPYYQSLERIKFHAYLRSKIVLIHGAHEYSETECV